MSAMIAEQTQPSIHADGTLTAIVAAQPRVENGSLYLALALPTRLEAEQAAGRFVLARCGAQSEWERGEQWSIYLRRPLYVAARGRSGQNGQNGQNEDATVWQFCAPAVAGDAGDVEDAGYAWLAQRRVGEAINLTGFFGNGFPLPPLVRRLLLVTEAARLGLLAPLLDAALDRGNAVSLLLINAAGRPVDVAALRATLPLSVELHTVHRGDWHSSLPPSLRWADQVCVALPASDLPPLAEAIRQGRLRLESGFAFALVESDLACGYGACLACVVPLANGSLTRACVHGPVFDLLELAGKG
jgi:dihydroorotate dehydrogenase electron transfer subunit